MMQQDKQMKEIKLQYLQIFPHLLFVTGNTPADGNTNCANKIVKQFLENSLNSID